MNPAFSPARDFFMKWKCRVIVASSLNLNQVEAAAPTKYAYEVEQIMGQHWIEEGVFFSKKRALPFSKTLFY